MLECALTARLGGDPELKTSKSGQRYFSVSAAVTSSNANEATWVRIACFGDRAVELAPQLKKGDAIYCEGRLSIERYTGRDGQERVGLSVAASTLGPSKIGRRKPARERKPAGAAAGDGTPAPGPHVHRDLDDEIPF